MKRGTSSIYRRVACHPSSICALHAFGWSGHLASAPFDTTRTTRYSCHQETSPCPSSHHLTLHGTEESGDDSDSETGGEVLLQSVLQEIARCLHARGVLLFRSPGRMKQRRRKYTEDGVSCGFHTRGLHVQRIPREAIKKRPSRYAVLAAQLRRCIKALSETLADGVPLQRCRADRERKAAQVAC